MTQLSRLYFESRAKEEYYLFPREIQKKADLLLAELNRFGTLKYPYGRKLKGFDLYEVRVIGDGIYRLIYTYMEGNIVILTCFKKKTQKTPRREIEKAQNRMNSLI